MSTFAPSLQQQASSLSPNQVFQRILISTPLQKKYHSNLSFKSVQQALSSQLQTLLKSSFYTKFNVYFGVESVSKRSLIEQKYKRKEQILKLKIQQTKRNIFLLSRSQDQQIFDRNMKEFQKNQRIIQQRADQVDHVDFIPCIYVEAQAKKPFYGHLMQEFNRKGAGMLNAKIGYRAPFFKLDTFQFKFQTPINNLRRKYFNFNMQWINPTKKYGNIFTSLTYANQSLFSQIDQKSKSFNIGIDNSKKKMRIQLQTKLRIPQIQSNFSQHCMCQYHLPSLKSSIKLSKTFINTIQFNDIKMGTYLQTKNQLTIPLISKAHFTKFQINYRKFYDMFFLGKYFQQSTVRKFLYASSLQTNASCNFVKYFGDKYVSDIVQNLQIRGFDQPNHPIPTYSNCKFSAKWNIHNYPVIGFAQITPFLYAQTGFSLLDKSKSKINEPKKMQFYGLGSLGMGLAYYVNPFTQIQIIYNLASYQSLKNRESTNFQIRIGIFD